jgi:CDP-2,3-bis-(O-geranylgeranyl)-sn-glycerol synthase
MFLAAQTLYLFAPLLVSSALAAVVMRFDLLRSSSVPIDAGMVWRDRRLLGDGKTWRGVVVAIAGCISTVAVQKHVIGTRAAPLWLLDYRGVEPFTFGAGLGVAAMLGELPNSFVKRRLGIPRGGVASGVKSIAFYVWDQVDVLTFTWPLLSYWLRPTTALIATSVALTLLLHPALSWLGYLLGVRTSAR